MSTRTSVRERKFIKSGIDENLARTLARGEARAKAARERQEKIDQMPDEGKYATTKDLPFPVLKPEKLAKDTGISIERAREILKDMSSPDQQRVITAQALMAQGKKKEADRVYAKVAGVNILEPESPTKKGDQSAAKVAPVLPSAGGKTSPKVEKTQEVEDEDEALDEQRRYAVRQKAAKKMESTIIIDDDDDDETGSEERRYKELRKSKEGKEYIDSRIRELQLKGTSKKKAKTVATKEALELQKIKDFQEEYVIVGNKMMLKAAFDKLPPNIQAQIRKDGFVKTLNKYNEAINKDSVLLGNGERVKRSEFNKLSKEDQKLLKEVGLVAFSAAKETPDTKKLSMKEINDLAEETLTLTRKTLQKEVGDAEAALDYAKKNYKKGDARRNQAVDRYTTAIAENSKFITRVRGSKAQVLRQIKQDLGLLEKMKLTQMERDILISIIPIVGSAVAINDMRKNWNEMGIGQKVLGTGLTALSVGADLLLIGKIAKVAIALKKGGQVVSTMTLPSDKSDEIKAARDLLNQGLVNPQTKKIIRQSDLVYTVDAPIDEVLSTLKLFTDTSVGFKYGTKPVIVSVAPSTDDIAKAGKIIKAINQEYPTMGSGKKGPRLQLDMHDALAPNLKGDPTADFILSQTKNQLRRKKAALKEAEKTKDADAIEIAKMGLAATQKELDELTALSAKINKAQGSNFLKTLTGRNPEQLKAREIAKAIVDSKIRNVELVVNDPSAIRSAKLIKKLVEEKLNLLGPVGKKVKISITTINKSNKHDPNKPARYRIQITGPHGSGGGGASLFDDAGGGTGVLTAQKGTAASVTRETLENVNAMSLGAALSQSGRLGTVLIPFDKDDLSNVPLTTMPVVPTPENVPFSTPFGTPSGTPFGTPSGDPAGTPTGDPAGTPTGDPAGTPAGGQGLGPMGDEVFGLGPKDTPSDPAPAPQTAPQTATKTKAQTKTKVKTKVKTKTKVIARRPIKPKIKPIVMPDFELPTGKKLQGKFPRVVRWVQGITEVTLDIDSGKSSFKRTSKVGTPISTFQVLKTDQTKPKSRKLKLGIANINVSGTGLKFGAPTRKVSSNPFRNRRRL
tara:strand:- start:1770 stop:5003 length:3234 start_codon:yes stop_codon:yes gene_type:complete